MLELLAIFNALELFGPCGLDYRRKNNRHEEEEEVRRNERGMNRDNNNNNNARQHPAISAEELRYIRENQRAADEALGAARMNTDGFAQFQQPQAHINGFAQEPPPLYYQPQQSAQPVAYNHKKEYLKQTKEYCMEQKAALDFIQRSRNATHIPANGFAQFQQQQAPINGFAQEPQPPSYYQPQQPAPPMVYNNNGSFQQANVPMTRPPAYDAATSAGSFSSFSIPAGTSDSGNEMPPSAPQNDFESFIQPDSAGHSHASPL